MREQIWSRILATLSTFILSIVLFLGLYATGEDVVQKNYVRLLFVHPAVAQTMYMAFAITTVCSLLWLWPKTRKPVWDQLAGASTEIGVVFAVLVLITGAIWGRPTWGVWWSWDPRITSSTVLLFMYLGVMAIRSIPASPAERAKRSAIVALIAFLNVPIVHYSVTWWRGLHQESSLRAGGKTHVRGWQLVAFLLSFLGFALLYFWMLIQRYRIARWEDRLQQDGLQAAIAQRRAENNRSIPGHAPLAKPGATT